MSRTAFKPQINTELPGPKARELIALSERHEPNCMSDQVPLVWQRGEGVVITDVDGNQFLDFCSGVLVANVGHCHPHYVRETQAQCAELFNCYDFVNPHRARLAEKLVGLTAPHLDKAFILTTGAETIESALKLARRVSEGHEIVSFEGAFHGRTFGAMSVGGIGGVKQGFGPLLTGCIQAPFCYCYRCPFDRSFPDCEHHCLDQLDEVVDRQSTGGICALITEPYQGAAGSIIPPEGYMEKLQAWCREREVLFILDEVQSSFGRTGTMFAYEHYGVEPDLLCLGKGLGSGVPCSAVVGRSEIMDVLSPGEMSSTNGGNPLSCRAALAAIKIVEDEDLPANSARVGGQMMERLIQMQADHECLGDVRGQGLVIGLEIVEDKESKTPAPELTKRIIHEAYLRGLAMIAPIGLHGNVIRIAPPLVITAEQAQAGLDILDQAFAAAR
ncbi:MAG: aspartate aminotransferase family protein [Armatimonadota bacterium]